MTPGPILCRWTLEDQFKVVVNETLQSQPQQYGDLSLDSEGTRQQCAHTYTRLT